VIKRRPKRPGCEERVGSNWEKLVGKWCSSIARASFASPFSRKKSNYKRVSLKLLLSNGCGLYVLMYSTNELPGRQFIIFSFKQTHYERSMTIESTMETCRIRQVCEIVSTYKIIVDCFSLT
jgi:hypothetical protein